MNKINTQYNPFFIKDYYIFEYSSIPKEIRDEFKNRLKKRKGANTQKNIYLINELEHIVKTAEYDNTNIFKKLNVSARMLDCHKSRLLKQLREYYFKWQYNKNDSAMEIIRKRFKLGMLREARLELIKTENEYSRKIHMKILNNEDKILLFEIYEKLFTCYNYLRDVRKINYYYKNASNMIQNIMQSDIDKIKKADILVRYHLLVSYKLTINRFKITNINKAINELENVLIHNKEYITAELTLKIYYRLGILYNVLKIYDKSIAYFKAGKELSVAKGYNAEANVFESNIMLRKFSQNNENAREYLEYHKSNYDNMLRSYSEPIYLLDFEVNYLRFLIYNGDPLTDKVTENYINHQILFSRKADALNSCYLELSDQLSENIIIWKHGKKYYQIEPDKDVLKNFSEMNKQSVFKFRNIYLPNVLSILYINITELEFWKYKDADFIYAELYIKKLERIIKLYKINISKSWVESIKLGLKIFEELQTNSSNIVYKKYINRIEKFINTIKSEKQIFNITSDYAKLIFIAQKLDSEDLDNKIIELTKWINIKFPETIKEIEQRINKSKQKNKLDKNQIK
jgi:hypothetical protein